MQVSLMEGSAGRNLENIARRKAGLYYAEGSGSVEK
jgi:hypothetical protein